MSITSDRIKENGFIHALADEAAAEIEQLEAENAKLIEACQCFRHFVNMRGGSWAEMLEILTDALSEHNDRNQEAHQETMQDKMREEWHEEMRLDAFGHRC